MGRFKVGGRVRGATDGPSIDLPACYRSKKERTILGCDAHGRPTQRVALMAKDGTQIGEGLLTSPSASSEEVASLEAASTVQSLFEALCRKLTPDQMAELRDMMSDMAQDDEPTDLGSINVSEPTNLGEIDVNDNPTDLGEISTRDGRRAMDAAGVKSFDKRYGTGRIGKDPYETMFPHANRLKPPESMASDSRRAPPVPPMTVDQAARLKRMFPDMDRLK